MVYGYTYGELALTAFIFGLIYLAAYLPRAGRMVGRALGPDEPTEK